MRLRLHALGLVLAATGLMAACASQPAVNPQAGAPAPATTTSAAAPTTAAHAASTATSRATPRATTTAAPKATRAAAEPDVEPVSCGPVGPDGGAQVDLIADDTPAGRVGCTEAITVITDYYRDAPTKAEGTAHYLVIDGWACLADTGAYGSGSIGCSRDGLGFHTQP